MTEEGLKLSEVIKLCEDGAYIKGDKFKGGDGYVLIFNGDSIIFENLKVNLKNTFNYECNIYEVNK